MLALLNSVDQVIVFVPLVSTGMVTAMELQVASSAIRKVRPPKKCSPVPVVGLLEGMQARHLPNSLLRRAMRHLRGESVHSYPILRSFQGRTIA